MALLSALITGVDVSDNDVMQDFYTHVVDYIAESDALNGTAFSNAALDPDGSSTPLSAGGNAQLEGLPKLVMQVPPLATLCCSSVALRTRLSNLATNPGARNDAPVCRVHMSSYMTYHRDRLLSWIAQTFARHGIPLAAPLAPPILNVSVTCPGASQSNCSILKLHAARMLPKGMAECTH